MTRGDGPKGHAQMPNLLRFMAIFHAVQFPTPAYHPHFLPTFFSYLSPFPFQPATPFPKKVNKKLMNAIL